jgi:hypothetical protein
MVSMMAAKERDTRRMDNLRTELIEGGYVQAGHYLNSASSITERNLLAKFLQGTKLL